MRALGVTTLLHMLPERLSFVALGAGGTVIIALVCAFGGVRQQKQSLLLALQVGVLGFATMTAAGAH